MTSAATGCKSATSAASNDSIKIGRENARRLFGWENDPRRLGRL